MTVGNFYQPGEDDGYAEPDWDSVDRCLDCGRDGDEHDAPGYGGACHVCGDCPGWLS